MTVSKVTTPIWRDAHLHLRQTKTEGNLLPTLAKFTRRFCSEAVVMPNTVPAIDTAEMADWYRRDCENHLGSKCRPLVTMKLTPNTTPDTVRMAKQVGVVGFKVYPEGVTTNSGGDTKMPSSVAQEEPQMTRDMLVSPPQSLLEVFETIQDEDLILLWHGELPGVFILDREAAFLKVFENTARNFPQMRQVLEHITTEAAVNEIDLLAADGLPVAATITMHHLWMKNGLDDVMGGLLKPDWFCKPVAKRSSDHEALVRALKHPKVFFGSDSAAHPPERKYGSRCCAGCLTATHPEMLVQLFEEFGVLDLLSAFTSERMGSFYRLRPSAADPLQFVKEEWTVPQQVEGLVPFLAGTKLQWKLLDD